MYALIIALRIIIQHNIPSLKTKEQLAVTAFAEEWVNRGFADAKFLEYMAEKVSFPWTMIDRITPRPAENVREMLAEKGVEGMETITTDKGTVIAPFVNTEHVSYLVIQDEFPNGRPPLEKAGVIFCDSPEEVAGYEKMKVGACLNPIQTTLETTNRNEAACLTPSPNFS